MKKNTIRLVTATLLSSLLVSALCLGSYAARRGDDATGEVTRVSCKTRPADPVDKPAKTRPAKTRPVNNDNEPAKTRPANTADTPSKTRPVSNAK